MPVSPLTETIFCPKCGGKTMPMKGYDPRGPRVIVFITFYCSLCTTVCGSGAGDHELWSAMMKADHEEEEAHKVRRNEDNDRMELRSLRREIERFKASSEAMVKAAEDEIERLSNLLKEKDNG